MNNTYAPCLCGCKRFATVDTYLDALERELVERDDNGLHVAPAQPAPRAALPAEMVCR